MTRREIIVAGVSCSGKSTFISGPLMASLADEGVSANSVETHFAGKLIKAFGLRGDQPRPLCLGAKPVRILHYNLLLPAVADQEDCTSLEHEPLLRALLARDTQYELLLCYAPDRVIRDRMTARDAMEPELAPSDVAYPVDRYLSCFERVDQRQLVLAFGRALEAKARQISVVFSNHAGTTDITWDDFTNARPTPALEAALTGSG